MSGNGNGDKEICGFCVFCHKMIDPNTKMFNPKTGICRRYPPQVIIATVKTNVADHRTGKQQTVQVVQPQHPFVDFTTPACGEFKLADDKKN